MTTPDAEIPNWNFDKGKDFEENVKLAGRFIKVRLETFLLEKKEAEERSKKVIHHFFNWSINLFRFSFVF